MSAKFGDCHAGSYWQSARSSYNDLLLIFVNKFENEFGSPFDDPSFPLVSMDSHAFKWTPDSNAKILVTMPNSLRFTASAGLTLACPSRCCGFWFSLPHDNKIDSPSVTVVYTLDNGEKITQHRKSYGSGGAYTTRFISQIRICNDSKDNAVHLNTFAYFARPEWSASIISSRVAPSDSAAS